jgi:twitching motility protein PilT
MANVNELIAYAKSQRGSDLHIAANLPVKCRIDGKITTLVDGVMTAADCDAIARELAGNKYDEACAVGELDMALTAECGVRCRVNIFKARDAFSFAIRLLSNEIPEISALELPPAVMNFPNYQSGLVLVTGETGSGKSTTLAAILDKINHTESKHIITLEDPIEYVYKPDRCLINQREIGRDTQSYANGLRAALREDPDVILIGEMRDLETIETALTAAETGHLVFATLHTNSAADSVDRIISVFPAARQQQIRTQLAGALKAVLAQQLIPRKEKGRIAACEVMTVSSAIQNLIREGKSQQIENFIVMNGREGNILMDNAVQNLMREGKVDMQEAQKRLRNQKK